VLQSKEGMILRIVRISPRRRRAAAVITTATAKPMFQNGDLLAAQVNTLEAIRLSRHAPATTTSSVTRGLPSVSAFSLAARWQHLHGLGNELRRNDSSHLQRLIGSVHPLRHDASNVAVYLALAGHAADHSI